MSCTTISIRSTSPTLLVRELGLTVDSGSLADMSSRQCYEGGPCSIWERAQLRHRPIWSAAYVFGQIPSNLLLTRVGSQEPESNCVLIETIGQRSPVHCIPGICLDSLYICPRRCQRRGSALRLPLFVSISAFTRFPFQKLCISDLFCSVGLFETGHFPAVMYVGSSYYKPHELARRNSLIQVFTSVGPLFSGFLMAAVHAGLNGSNGLPGWRWMYM